MPSYAQCHRIHGRKKSQPKPLPFGPLFSFRNIHFHDIPRSLPDDSEIMSLGSLFIEKVYHRSIGSGCGVQMQDVARLRATEDSEIEFKGKAVRGGHEFPMGKIERCPFVDACL